ncbi:MAG: TetR/AcrR family transcriptional regulator [Myxococcales bacterium]|nr:TetR/AcrR family transcriptional regulator [Myxococcales bacterium]
MRPRGSRSEAVEARTALRLARKEKRQEGRREGILDAARRVLAANGLEGLTLGAVASEADLSKPALHYYFPTREDLVGALTADYLSREADAVIAAVHAAKTDRGAAEAALRAKVAFAAADLQGFRVAYVLPLVVTLPRELTVSRVYPPGIRTMDALSERLARVELAKGLSPRKLANLCFCLAQGVLSLVSGLAAIGGATKFPLDELTDEACALLASAMKAPRKLRG